MAVTIRAHFDGKVIVPDEAVDLPVNQRPEVEMKPIEDDADASTITERLRRLAHASGRIAGPAIPAKTCMRIAGKTTAMPTLLELALDEAMSTYRATPNLEPLWSIFRNALRPTIRASAQDEGALINAGYTTFNRTLRSFRHLSNREQGRLTSSSSDYLQERVALLCAFEASSDPATFDLWHMETSIGLQELWKNAFPLHVGQSQ